MNTENIYPLEKMSARTLIEKQPDYSYVAARLLLPAYPFSVIRS